jgi:hypothetical protein
VSNTNEARWEGNFVRLERFVNEHGHALVDRDYVVDGIRLGAWVARLRSRKDDLSAERQARLEALMGWVWDVPEAQWEHGYNWLQQFLARAGHAQVPQKHREQGFRLGTWVLSQRQHYKKGQLSANRVKRLESLPDWDWKPRKGPRPVLIS